jgi:hypothetical protein
LKSFFPYFKSHFGEKHNNTWDGSFNPFKSRFGEGHIAGDPTSTPCQSHTIQQLFGEFHEVNDHDAELADLADYAVCQLDQLKEGPRQF